MTVVDPVYLPSGESISTPCSSPNTISQPNLPIHMNQSTNVGSSSAKKQLMAHNPRIVYCSPDTQSQGNSSMANENFDDWACWAQGTAEGLQHSISLGPQPIEFCCPSSLFLKHQNRHPLGFKPAINQHNIPAYQH